MNGQSLCRNQPEPGPIDKTQRKVPDHAPLPDGRRSPRTRANSKKLLNDDKPEFKPSTPDETFLVEQMAQSRWTLARARRIESHLLNQLAGQAVEPDNPDARIAAERSYFRARRELQ